MVRQNEFILPEFHENIIFIRLEYNILKDFFLLYEGWNFDFGNTPLDWTQELLE